MCVFDITVSVWAPDQVEWPRPIRSELHVESLKRPKHAVHDEWLGTLLMARIKTIRVFNTHNFCVVGIFSQHFVARYRIPVYNKLTVYMVIYHTNSVGMCHGG